MNQTSGDAGAARWRMLALVAGAEILGMSAWFSASAVGSRLAELWSLGLGEVGWLVGVVQVGFVAGTALAAVLNLADVLPRKASVSPLAGSRPRSASQSGGAAGRAGRDAGGGHPRGR